MQWICEQAHQQLKEELGLDHFEGRSWQGLHRHALMTMIAYAFLQHRRLKTARREKRFNALPPQPTLPAAPSHPRTYRSATEAALPALPHLALDPDAELAVISYGGLQGRQHGRANPTIRSRW
jgi:hypothetical protein